MDPEPTPAAEPEPAKEEKKEEEDLWSFGTSAKDKKKAAKKAGKAAKEEEKIVEDPLPEPAAETQSAMFDDFEGWGMSTSKKVSSTIFS